MEQLEAAGCPAQVNVTVWLKPFDGVTFKVKFGDCPALIVAEPGETDIEKSPPDAVKAILDRKTSVEAVMTGRQLAQAVWNELVVGKSGERVNPTT
jgi:hypothetical protein